MPPRDDLELDVVQRAKITLLCQETTGYAAKLDVCRVSLVGPHHRLYGADVSLLLEHAAGVILDLRCNDDVDQLPLDNGARRLSVQWTVESDDATEC